MGNETDWHKLRVSWCTADLDHVTRSRKDGICFLTVFQVCPMWFWFFLEDSGMSANILYFGSRAVNIGVWHCFFQVFYSFQSSTIFRLFCLCSLARFSLADWSNPEISVWGKCFKPASNPVGPWGELRPFWFYWEDLTSPVNWTRSPGIS